MASSGNQVKISRGAVEKQVSVKDNSVKATDLKPLGLVVYDPGYVLEKGDDLLLTNARGSLKQVHEYCRLYQQNHLH